MYKIDEIKMLRLGQRDENLARALTFDCSDWLELYPGASIAILFRRPGESTITPMITTLIGTTLTWQINDFEVGITGVGNAEIRAVDTAGLRRKSRIIPCSIEETLLGDDETVLYTQDQVDETLAHISEAAQAAQAAQASEEAAALSAQEAGESATSASAAADVAVSARDAAQAAQTAAETAQHQAEAAQSGVHADAVAAEQEKVAAQAAQASAQGAASQASADRTAAESARADAEAAAVHAEAVVEGIDQAGADQVAAVNAAGQAQVAAVNQAGTTQVGNVNAAGTTQVNAVQAKGTQVINSIPADYSALSEDVTDLKSTYNVLDQKYLSKRFTSDSNSILYDTTDIYLNQGDQVIIDSFVSSTYAVAYISSQSISSTGVNIGAVGTYVFTANVDGYLAFAHRVLGADVWFSDFNIVSDRGDSKIKAASQKLVETAFDAVGNLATSVQTLSNNLDGKYDRYKVETVSGLELSDFVICPEQYKIVQYDNTDAVQHGPISNDIYSKFKSEIKEITFKIYQQGTYIIFALSATKYIRWNINATTYNVGGGTIGSGSPLTSIYRNENCPSVVRGDTMRIKQNGTKIAVYLVVNGADVPIMHDEWIDVYADYATEVGIEAEDVGFGFSSTNMQRNEPLAYDFAKIVVSGDHFMPYDEVNERLSELESGAGYNPYKIDLFMFMGQSNMAGRGNGSQAPNVIENAGFEFRAISDPTKLYPIVEPFGIDENVQDAIYDYLGQYKAKAGDMVPAFVNAYFSHTHVSIVGVSASEGGTRIALWQPNTARDTDAFARFTVAKNWLEHNGYTIRHKYILWCQGESNGDDGMSKADYKSAFATFANAWFARGIEKIFVVKIGNYNGSGSQDYNTIMTAQNEICQTMENVVMASTDFAGMKARGLMKDDFHYTQTAYNEVGTYAGRNVAFYVNTEKEPTMFDTQDGSLYYSHKN